MVNNALSGAQANMAARDVAPQRFTKRLTCKKALEQEPEHCLKLLYGLAKCAREETTNITGCIPTYFRYEDEFQQCFFDTLNCVAPWFQP